MGSGNKIIYRNDFNPQDTAFGEPDTCTVAYQGSTQIITVLPSSPATWGLNGTLENRAFEAKKGMTISIKTKVLPVLGTAGNWPDACVGVVVDSETMPDDANDDVLALYVAANSFVHALVGPSTGLTLTNATPLMSGIVLGEYYEAKIEVLQDGRAALFFNGHKCGETAESVVGKILRPYRNPYTPGAVIQLDSLVVRA